MPFAISACKNVSEKFEYLCGPLGYKDKDVYMQYFLNVDAIWINTVTVARNLTISPYGWCHTFNIVNDLEIYHENSTSEYFRFQRPNLNSYIEKHKRIKTLLPENKQQLPLKTTQSSAGFLGNVYMFWSKYYNCMINSVPCKDENKHLTLVVHSPYETPDIRHRSLHLRFAEFAQLTLDPQIKITDDTLMSLDVDEYGTTFMSLLCLLSCVVD